MVGVEKKGADFVKKIFVVVLSFVLLFGTTVSVEASFRPSNEAMEAGYHLSEVIDLIINRYVGGPITVDELMEAALRGMTDILDEYSVYLSAAELAQFTQSLTGRLVGIGVSMMEREDGRVEVTRVLPGTPAEEAGVLPGDIVVSVDAMDVTGFHRDDVVALITNPNNERVLISFDRDGYIVTFDILKAEISSPTVIVDRLENIPEASGLRGLDNFRYMQISSVGIATGDDVRTAIEQMQSEGVVGIILDLRGNTGGYLDITVDIANQLVPAGMVLQTVNQAGRRRTYSSILQEAPFEIVVLVNRFTASAAEVIASALQDADAAVVIGERTFGKGLVQSVYGLATGGALKLTTEEYFRRSGGTINGIGVTPCIYVGRRSSLDEMDNALRQGLEVLVGG